MNIDYVKVNINPKQNSKASYLIRTFPKWKLEVLLAMKYNSAIFQKKEKNQNRRIPDSINTLLFLYTSDEYSGS